MTTLSKNVHTGIFTRTAMLTRLAVTFAAGATGLSAAEIMMLPVQALGNRRHEMFEDSEGNRLVRFQSNGVIRAHHIQRNIPKGQKAPICETRQPKP